MVRAAVGDMLSHELPLFAVNLVRGDGSPALVGDYRVHIQPAINSGCKRERKTLGGESDDGWMLLVYIDCIMSFTIIMCA